MNYPSTANTEAGAENIDYHLSMCLIGKLNDPFNIIPNKDIIHKWFVNRWQVTAGLKVNPLKHNQFLFEFPSQIEASRVKASEWFWKQRRLTLEWQSQVYLNG